jgi:Flp pilus assembly protein TadG
MTDTRHRYAIRRFAADTRGNVALLFGLLVVPLALGAGIGVDYSRAANMRASLQSTVDSAALAGAAAYTSSASVSSAQSLASGYVTKGAAAVATQITLGTPTVTPGTQTSGGAVTAYTMTVTASATVPTTLMALVMSTMTINATATAKNPIVTGTIGLTNWKSSACDTNSVYWYVVPADGSVPPTSALNLMFTNSGGTNPASVAIPVSASQKIGFAFKNVTGGGCGYGSNQYGGSQGTTHWFYSSRSPPNAVAYGATASKDCSLQVIKGVVSYYGTTTYAAPKSQCFTTSTSPTMATVLSKAAPSCADLAGASYQYTWNDMGGTTDDLDYDDGIYTYSCDGGSGSGTGVSTTGVVLIN